MTGAGRERWLSNEEHLLPLQMIQLQLLAHMEGGLQPATTPVPGELIASSGFHGQQIRMWWWKQTHADKTLIYIK